METLKKKIISGYHFSKEEIIEILTNVDLDQLCNLAGSLRDYYVGDIFDTCSIINARSGKCSEDCKWCAQSAFYKVDMQYYDLIDEETCLEMAKLNAKYKVDKFSFVTSGRALPQFHLNKICGYAKNIKQQVDIKLCASMGLLNKQQLKQLQESGIERYHCNLESSERYFKTLCTTHTYQEKIETIKAAHELGMPVCSGGIIGMGETVEDRIDLAITLRDLGILSIPINILFPIEGTPLGKQSPLTKEEILQCVVIFRILNPKAFLRFAGGRKLIKHIERDAIKAGMNAAIVGDLLTTLGSDVSADMNMIEEMGFYNSGNKKQ